MAILSFADWINADADRQSTADWILHCAQQTQSLVHAFRDLVEEGTDDATDEEGPRLHLEDALSGDTDGGAWPLINDATDLLTRYDAYRIKARLDEINDELGKASTTEQRQKLMAEVVHLNEVERRMKTPRRITVNRSRIEIEAELEMEHRKAEKKARRKT